MLGIIIATYLLIAGVLGAAHNDGTVKDDTVSSTVAFEKAAR